MTVPVTLVPAGQAAAAAECRDKGRLWQGSADALGFSPKTCSHAQSSLMAQPMGPWGHGALIPVSLFLAFRTSQLWSLGVCVYVAWEYKAGQGLGEGELSGMGGNIFQRFL